MADLLPKDLIFEILQRLPAASLLRFRCVCKEWRDRIDRRDFPKLHLNSVSKRSPSLLLIRNQDYSPDFGVVDLISVCNGGLPLAFKEFQFPGQGGVGYVGQCNGLFCLMNHTAVLLWNPLTRNHAQYQFDQQPLQGLRFRDWAFGYDNVSDDYKVVAMAESEMAAGDGRYLVWLYSLKSRSWKRINDFPYLIVDNDQSGVFVNGELHWKVCQWKSNVSICALHLGKLEYNLVPLPDYSSENIGKDFVNFGALHGRLYVIYYGFDNDDFDLWTMKEYGVKGCWTKLISCASYPRGLICLAYLVPYKVLLFTSYSSEMRGYEFRTISVGRGTRSAGRRYEIKSRSFGRLLRSIVHMFMSLALFGLKLVVS